MDATRAPAGKADGRAQRDRVLPIGAADRDTEDQVPLELADAHELTRARELLVDDTLEGREGQCSAHVSANHEEAGCAARAQGLGELLLRFNGCLVLVVIEGLPELSEVKTKLPGPAL